MDNLDRSFGELYLEADDEEDVNDASVLDAVLASVDDDDVGSSDDDDGFDVHEDAEEMEPRETLSSDIQLQEEFEFEDDEGIQDDAIYDFHKVMHFW